MSQPRHRREAGRALRVAVNVSMDNLTRLDFPEFVLTALARRGVPTTDLPFNKLKIDRSFVCGHPERAVEWAIFSSSVQMAHRLDMTVVAEGVEDHADWEAVRASGCDTAQGYFVARPMPADASPGWAARWQQRCMAW